MEKATTSGAVETLIWMIGDSGYDILAWHALLLEAGVVPIARTNPWNTDDPPDIKYRVKYQIDAYSEDFQLRQSILDETSNRRTHVERTNNAYKYCGIGHVRARSLRPRRNTNASLTLSSDRYPNHN